MRIKLLDLGHLRCARKELIRSERPDEKIISPVTAVLIEHPQIGWILFDTGNDGRWQDTYPEHIRKVYPVERIVTIQEAIAKEGLQLEDISMLILSHLHFDHAGGLKYFSNTAAAEQILISAAELEQLQRSEEQGAYVKRLYDLKGIGFKAVTRKEQEVASGIKVFVQNCHTPGLLGMIITLEKTGTLIFTSDTIYTKQAYEYRLPPGGSINKSDKEFYDNLRLVSRLEEKYGAQLIFGHDAAQATEWIQKGWLR